MQNLETVNPLSKTRIEFKTKAHKDDVETVYLLKSDELIKMNKNRDVYLKTLEDILTAKEEFINVYIHNVSTSY